MAEVFNRWVCFFCESEIKSKSRAYNIVYTDYLDRAICPICGTANLVKVERSVKNERVFDPSEEE